ncbi:fibronectin type III domain-containing protein [Actinomyces wuliandei]|uniref:fibronectin type III domain-containing protein n=1 Tax=Actinomyces wuliandei TaxID=2057743 RepID=UPI000FDB4E3C|nr:fibronectin type III domain-containing protein [Actinomyces wuliandei]
MSSADPAPVPVPPAPESPSPTSSLATRGSRRAAAGHRSLGARLGQHLPVLRRLPAPRGLHGLPGTTRRLTRRLLVRQRLSALTALLCVTVLVLAAWLHDGTAQADLRLHDGGVWVTSASDHLVARLNYPSREVDGAIRTTSASFDVTQDAADVLVPDTTDGSVATVDVAQVSFSEHTQLSQADTVLQGGDRVVAVNSAEGTVRATTVDAVGSLAAVSPLISSMPDVTAVAGQDGSIHAVSATTGSLVSLPATADGWETAAATSLSPTPGTDLAVTAVGDQPVVLERGTGVLHLPEGGTTDLGQPGLTLQQAGPSADSVLVASRTALVSVPLDGGEVTEIPAGSGSSGQDSGDAQAGTAPEGVAAQPVRLGRCVYAAWSGSGQFVRECSGITGGNETLHDESLATSSAPVFRVNRDAIVLNDLETGSVWLPDEELVLLDDWTDVTAQTDDSSDVQDDSADTSEAQSPPERTEENHAPEASDDTFGARPGRSTLLPVLANDSDPDGDVLTATPLDTGGTVTAAPAQGGLALTLEVPSEATGTYSVPYTADDGRGMSDSAVATVEVHGWEVNEAPEQTTVPSLTVTEGAAGSLSVLGSWLDPDGDDLYLVSAHGEGLDVKASSEGTVTVREMGAGAGTREMTVVVSDGQETSTGTVSVEVRTAETAPPVANADHVRVVAGSRVVVSPLDNDTSPSGTPLHLADVQDAPTGTEVSVDQQAGVFTFSTDSSEASGQDQTLYLTYDVMDGAGTSQGIVRIDVVARAEATVPPEVEDDTALLADSGATTVDPLSNDFDPSGGILVLQSVTAPADSGVTVTVVEHSLLQVSAAGPVPPGTSVEYTVTNGTATTTGTVSIVPVASTDPQPPVVGDDTAVVRAGDVVSVPVLDNDSSPSGLALSVSPELGLAGQDLGTAWVSQDTVRFRADDQAGRTTLSYTATDAHGQATSGAVTIEVRPRDDDANSAPSPRGLEARTVSTSPAAVTVPLDGIDPDGDSVSLVGLDQAPSLGTVDVSSTWLTYTPLEDATGTDTFTYVVEDRLGAQATATVRVGVAAATETNIAPVATDDLVVAQPGRTVAVDVLSNDLDADGDTLSLEGAPTPSDPALGVSTRGGRLVADLPQEEGVYSVTYTVSDGRGGLDTGTVTVQVSREAPLASPVGVDDYVTVDQVDAQGVVTVPVLDNDLDADGSPWDLTLSTDEPDVQVSEDSITLTVGEEPRLVLYTVTDADGLTGNAVVVVPSRSALRPRLDAASVPVRVPADTPTDIPLSSHVLTRAGTSAVVTDPSTVHTGAGTQEATLADGGGVLRLTPDDGFTGRTSVTLTVADGTGPEALSATLTLPVTVDATSNTPPVLTPTEITAAPGEEPVAVDLTSMTTDPDETDTLSFSVGSAPEGFEVALSGSTLSVTALAGADEGTAGSVEVTVSDGVNDPVTSTLPLRVGGSARPLMTTVPASLDSDGSPVSVDIATLVTNPFPDEPVTLNGTPQVDSGQGDVSVSGTTVTISPATGFHGRMSVSYRVMDATGSPDREVSGTVLVTVAAAPEAPTAVRAEATGATAMTVRWSPGADNGSPVTGYTLTEVGGAGRWSCSGSPCQATGLTPGRSYSFQVVATSAAGDSVPSAPSPPEVFSVAADVPAAPVLSAGQGELTVSWSAVPPIEGATMRYEVRLSDGTTHTTQGTSLTLRAPSVSAGTAYTATVRAVPSTGEPSAYSSPSASATPYDAPGPPGTPQVRASGSSLTVSWSPAAANGSPVRYTVRYSGPEGSGSKDVGSSTSYTVNATSGTWSFTVVASNDAGSTSSSSAEYTHRTEPLAPSAPSAQATGSNGRIQVSASARAGNGWASSDLTVQYSVDQVTWTSSTTISGLTDGKSYTVYARVVSSDQRASSVVSGASVTPHGPPSAPAISCSAGRGDHVVCSWSPGASGGLPNTYERRWRADDDDKWEGPASLDSGKSFGFRADDDDAQACVRARNSAGQYSDWACDEVDM